MVGYVGRRGHRDSLHTSPLLPLLFCRDCHCCGRPLLRDFRLRGHRLDCHRRLSECSLHLGLSPFHGLHADESTGRRRSPRLLLTYPEHHHTTRKMTTRTCLSSASSLPQSPPFPSSILSFCIRLSLLRWPAPFFSCLPCYCSHYNTGVNPLDFPGATTPPGRPLYSTHPDRRPYYCHDYPPHWALAELPLLLEGSRCPPPSRSVGSCRHTPHLPLCDEEKLLLSDLPGALLSACAFARNLCLRLPRLHRAVGATILRQWLDRTETCPPLSCPSWTGTTASSALAPRQARPSQHSSQPPPLPHYHCCNYCQHY